MEQNKTGNCKETGNFMESPQHIDVLCTYDEMARLAVKEDSDFEFYLNKKQAFEEYRNFLQSEEAKKMSFENLKEIMLLFYRGSDLIFSPNVIITDNVRNCS